MMPSPRTRRAFIALATVTGVGAGAGCGSSSYQSGSQQDSVVISTADSVATTVGVASSAGAGSTVVDSTVVDSTVVDSTVVDSTVVDGTVVDGTVEEGEAAVPAPGEIEPGLQPLVDLAIKDLTTRLSIGTSEVLVVSAAAMVWPDKGLGCPQPGMQYAQVTVDGALIELAVSGEVYRYHSGGSKEPFLCEQAFTAQTLPPNGY